MSSKYVMQQYFNANLDCQVVVIDDAKNIVTFFDQAVDNGANSVVISEIR